MTKFTTAEEYFTPQNNDSKFTFVKYLNNDSDKISYKSINSAYKLKCKKCSTEKDIKRGNSKGYEICATCNKNDRNLLKATTTKVPKLKLSKRVDTLEEEVTEIKTDLSKLIEEEEQEEEQIIFPNLPLPPLPPLPPAPALASAPAPAPAPKVKNKSDGLDFKIFDRKNVINVPINTTEKVGDYYITTSDDKKNLLNHVFLEEDKAISLNDFVFIRANNSIFSVIKSVSNIKTKTSAASEDNDSINPYNLAEIFKKNKSNKDWYDIVSKYFEIHLSDEFNSEIELSEDCFIFNSIVKFRFISKTDSDISFKSNFCKVYLISLILDEDTDADIMKLQRKDQKTLMNSIEDYKKVFTAPEIENITNSYVKNTSIISYEINHMKKVIILKNMKKLKGFEINNIRNNQYLLNSTENELFYMKTGIDDKSFLT